MLLYFFLSISSITILGTCFILKNITKLLKGIKITGDPIDKLLPIESLESLNQPFFMNSNKESLDEFVIANEEGSESISIKPKLISDLDSKGDWNEYNPIYTKEIDNALKGIHYGNFPIDLVRLISSYNFIDPLKDLYESVMNDLNLTIDQKSKLDFYSDDFLKNLALLISSRKDFSKSMFSSHDLSRLAFKKIIQMKNKLLNSNDHEFSLASKDIQEILSLIYQNRHFNLVFDLRTMSLDDYSNDLLPLEILENYYKIVPRFFNAMKYFYIDRKIVSCKRFKNKFFSQSNGNPNGDILFKLFIIRYDYYGKMKECIEIGFQSDLMKIPIRIKENVKREIEKLKYLGPGYFSHFDFDYISDFILDLYLLHNSRIWVYNLENLMKILWKLKKSEQLKREIIESVLGFGWSGSVEWNQGQFMKYLNECKESFIIDTDAYLLCNECLEMFNGIVPETSNQSRFTRILGLFKRLNKFKI